MLDQLTCAAPFHGEGIECLHHPESYAGGNMVFHVGPPKPDAGGNIVFPVGPPKPYRLKGRVQTEQHRPA